jgi:hypothetical protein
MSRIPGGQRPEVMERKRQEAEKLLRQGLSVTRVSQQVNCSRAFVRKVRSAISRDEQELAG